MPNRLEPGDVENLHPKGRQGRACGSRIPPFLLGDIRLWRSPSSGKLWVCPAGAEGPETYPHMELSEVLEMLRDPDERPPHRHADYGDGQCGQQPVPTHGAGGAGRGCLHGVQMWNGQPWPTLHALGLQIHNLNRSDIHTDGQIQSLQSIVFWQDGLDAPHNLSTRLQAVHVCRQVDWCIMKTAAGYRGYHGVCNRCGAVMLCAWSRRSTRGWLDHQRANLLAFLGLQIPVSLMRPLEPTLPMV